MKKALNTISDIPLSLKHGFGKNRATPGLLFYDGASAGILATTSAKIRARITENTGEQSQEYVQELIDKVVGDAQPAIVTEITDRRKQDIRGVPILVTLSDGTQQANFDGTRLRFMVAATGTDNFRLAMHSWEWQGETYYSPACVLYRDGEIAGVLMALEQKGL